VVASNIYRLVGSSEIDVVKAAMYEIGAKLGAAKFTEVTSPSIFGKLRCRIRIQSVGNGGRLRLDLSLHERSANGFFCSGEPR